MYNNYFIVFFIVLMNLVGHAAGKTVIDSLTARLQSELHDTNRVKTLNDLAWELMYANPDTAIILSSEALSIAEPREWQSGIANSIGQLGTFNWLKGDYPKALEYYFKALKMSEELDRKTRIASNLGNIGIVYRNQGDYPKALEYYFKALKMNEELGRKPGIAKNLGNIGIVYRNQGDYPKALEYYFKALKMDEELSNKNGVARHLGNIGIVYNDQGDYPKALEYFFKALKMNEELDRKTGIAINLGNIGKVYKEQGDSAVAASHIGRDLAMAGKYPKSLALPTDLSADEPTVAEGIAEAYYAKALEYYFNALKMDEELDRKSGIAISLGNIGSLYTKTGEFEKAELTLQKALTLSKEIGAKERLKSQYKFLSNLYDTTGRPAQAFETYKLYIIYRDSIANEENTKAQTRTEMKYEYEKAELVKEQEAVEAQRLVNETTARRDNLQYSIVLICLLAIGVLVAMLGRLSLPIRMAEGIIFFSFLILFEFILVLADPYIETWSGGAPGIKLLFNAGIAALIFPAHAFFENKLKSRIVKS